MLEALLRAGVAQRTTRGIGACYPTGVTQRRPLLSLPGQQRLGAQAASTLRGPAALVLCLPNGLDTVVTGATRLLRPRRS